MPESYCWLALTLEASIPVIVLPGFNLCSCQIADLVSMQDRKVNIGQLEAIGQLQTSLPSEGNLRACGPDSLSLSALPGWAPDAHFLSIIHHVMFLIGEKEAVQSLGVTYWHKLKMDYVGFS